MAQLANKPCAGDWSIGGEGDWSKRHDDQFAALQSASAEVDPAVSLVGALVSFPWADGAAYYRVCKDKPLLLEHIPYSDAWQIPYPQIRGLRRVDVVAEIESAKRMKEFLLQRS